MRTTRIELDGSAGHVTIERPAGRPNICIASIVRQPRQGQRAWMVWDVPADIGADALFQIATEVQRRTDGSRGTNSMIHDYYRDLRRFAD
ncbi:MAG: hypothetical protein GC159_17445 [Phycisphaera sp.]|nr:hypothetical protein [Phycisphaera sp.]